MTAIQIAICACHMESQTFNSDCHVVEKQESNINRIQERLFLTVNEYYSWARTTKSLKTEEEERKDRVANINWRK